MFTKDDFRKYFGQLARMERKMIYGVHELAGEIDDSALKKILHDIGEREIKHYNQVLKLPQVVGLGHFEGRRESREDVLGIVRLRDAENPGSIEVKAYCVDLSKNGICLESPEDFSVSSVWDLEIQLLNNQEIMTHRGRLARTKKIESDCLIGGIDFLF